jgi:hypothetical protein
MAAKKPATQQMGLRLDAELLDKLREYANAHPYKPSLTSLINAAMREWIASHPVEGLSITGGPSGSRHAPSQPRRK